MHNYYLPVILWCQWLVALLALLKVWDLCRQMDHYRAMALMRVLVLVLILCWDNGADNLDGLKAMDYVSQVAHLIH